MASKRILVSLFILAVSVSVCRSGTDKTLTERATGKDVVEAADYLIKNKQIFPDDHRFTVRMAYVVTQFGDDKDTFTTKFNIWGMVQAKFDVTKDVKSYPALTTYYTKINQTFGIDWNKVQFTDLSKPLIGALAVNLFLALNQPVPLLLGQQGDYYYKSFASNITGQMFHDKVKDMEKIGLCYGRMDLAIVLDGSGSIGAQNFKLAQDFVAKLVDTFSLNNVNLGFIVYSDVSTVVFPMNSNLGLTDMKTKILGTGYPGSGTNTSGAILTAKDMLLKATHREGSPRIMAIFTDGNPNDLTNTISASNDALKSNITLFGIGIGSGIDHTKLLSMVQNQSNHVFSMSSYQELSESFELMNSETCKVEQKPNVGTKVDNTVKQNEKRFFCYDLPQIGITISIEVEVGKTDSFYSYALKNPSSALNDGVISGKTYIPVVSSKRVCVSVEGIEVKNNFTISSEAGDKSKDDNSSNDLLKIKRKAQSIAKDALDTLKNHKQMSNHVCNQMSELYSEYEWICIVGEKVEISEHQLPRSVFQFGFSINVTDFYFIINVPDNSN